MSTPADPIARLTAAAALLRAALADPKLTAGPWLSLDHGDRLLRNQPGDEDRAPIYVVDEPMSNGANAAWIALLHPGVGEKIAAVLDRAALMAHATAWARQNPDLDVALALADAILGAGR